MTIHPYYISKASFYIFVHIYRLRAYWNFLWERAMKLEKLHIQEIDLKLILEWLEDVYL